MRAGEAFFTGSQTAYTSPKPISLDGGLYQITGVASVFGTIDFQQLAPDNVTWLSAVTTIVANGAQQVYLPPGQYQFVIAGATAAFASVVRINVE